MKPPVVAVLDVGKTNKKLAVYSRGFDVLGEERTTIESGEHNGLEVESTDALQAWFRDALKKLAGAGDIRAIAITAHGATAAMLSRDGSLSHPVISYTNPQPPGVREEFFKTFGARDELHRITCTPDLGFTNIAQILFYVKTRMPEVWDSTKHLLLYDSFLGYTLTGEMGIEPTYLGNHNYLWDFHAYDWSSVARGLGAAELFPMPLKNPWDRLGALKPEIAQACGVSPECVVTQGIHDSNANFLPYLAQGYSDFMLNSTGTWCVGMRQSATPDLSAEDIATKVLYNLDAHGRPLKTAIFPAGMEYDAFRAFTSEKDAGREDALREVVQDQKLFIFPGVLPDASVFPGSQPMVLHGDTAYTLEQLEKSAGQPMSALGQAYFAALNLSLALQTRASLTRCGLGKGTKVFIEGGFAKNVLYCKLLATLCPDASIMLTNQKEGTSFGAALTAWMLAEGLGLEELGKEFTIEATRVEAGEFGDLAAYERAFMDNMQRHMR